MYVRGIFMPKIIENLETRLMEEAKRQIESVGYSATTIRSVAQACGVGVGTVYNYFPSKDMLVASYMLTDWQSCMAVIHSTGQTATTPELVVRCIYDQIHIFADRNSAVIRDEAAFVGFAGVCKRYHTMLRSQLAIPLRRFCPDDFTAEFVTECLLSWALTDKSFDVIYNMIRKLF